VDRALPARRAPRFRRAAPGPPLRRATRGARQQRLHPKRRWRHHHRSQLHRMTALRTPEADHSKYPSEQVSTRAPPRFSRRAPRQPGHHQRGIARRRVCTVLGRRHLRTPGGCRDRTAGARHLPRPADSARESAPTLPHQALVPWALRRSASPSNQQRMPLQPGRKGASSHPLQCGLLHPPPRPAPYLTANVQSPLPPTPPSGPTPPAPPPPPPPPQ